MLPSDRRFVETTGIRRKIQRIRQIFHAQEQYSFQLKAGRPYSQGVNSKYNREEVELILWCPLPTIDIRNPPRVSGVKQAARCDLKSEVDKCSFTKKYSGAARPAAGDRARQLFITVSLSALSLRQSPFYVRKPRMVPSRACTINLLSLRYSSSRLDTSRY